MEYSADMQIIEFDSFETAFPVRRDEEDLVKRRFMTLFVCEGERVQVGGLSYVCRAQSFTGETFAVKRLLASAAVSEELSPASGDAARITEGRVAAFYEEYRNQLLVSRMRGFPRLFGYGTIGADPAIVMEWVEGVSLRDFSRGYSKGGGVVPAEVIAALGASVLEVLDTAGRLDSALVHRDLSPSNIMIRTSAASLSDQVERARFDVCLVDFGSAAASAPEDPSFTMSSHIWRNGTPEYAPPEMLTKDIPHVDELRKSQAIDVFALCSVLYELYAGHTPWRVGEHLERSPYRVKTERAPEEIALRRESDAPLVEVLFEGLNIEQASRPTVQELLSAFREIAPASAGKGSSSRNARPAMGRPAVAPSLYLPDVAHLRVASERNGGKRAGEVVSPAGQPASPITRRALIVGGLALAGAAIGGAVSARVFRNEAKPDFSGYLLADSLYSGNSLLPVMRTDDSAWILRDIGAGGEVAMGSGSREPGRFVSGLMRAYDPASRNYGFMTAVEGSPGAGGWSCAWRVLPRFPEAGDFSEEFGDGGSPGPGRLASAKDPRTGRWGYIGVDGEWRIAPAFSRSGRFSGGVAPVCFAGGSLWGAIDTSGNQVVEPQYAGLGVYSEDGLMAACEREGGRWGFIDAGGDWAVPGEYARVRRFGCGRAACLRDSGGLWGYVDKVGETVIEARFADALPFSDGVAPAKDGVSGLWGLIDTTGAWKAEPRFLGLGEKAGDVWPAHGSPAYVYDIYKEDREPWNAYTQANGDWQFGYGFIDENGEWVVKPVYGDVLIRPSEQ